jgi:hypothetical protein
MMRDLRFVELLGRTLEEVEQSDLVSAAHDYVEREEIEGRAYVHLPTLGVSFGFGESGELRSVFFDYEATPSEAATGIPSAATRAQVLRILGKPSRSGVAQVLPILGQQGPWDRWDRPEFSMHVQYSFENGAVAKVTLMHPSVVPK